MIDWSFPPELQAQYDRVVAQTRRLQAEMGIKPRTIEERAADYLKKKQAEAELAKLVGKKRPPLRYKV
jgi:type VI protein secretion system component VasK